MITELLSAVQSMQSLATLLKAANSLSNYNEIVSAVSEVNAKLMQANAVALASQEKQSSLSTKVQELEKECVRLKDWAAEKQHYELRQVAPGVFARVEKSVVGDMESTHKLCCNCFDNTVKSILQQNPATTPSSGRMLSLVCPKGCPAIIFRHYVSTS